MPTNQQQIWKQLATNDNLRHFIDNNLRWEFLTFYVFLGLTKNKSKIFSVLITFKPPKIKVDLQTQNMCILPKS